MDVLDYEDERTLFREPLEEAPPRGERLVPPVTAELCRFGEADEREEVRLDARLVPGTDEHVLDGVMDLLGDLRGVSCSSTPAWAFTISPSAQSVIPSPYARQRPCRQVTSSGSASTIRCSS